MSSASTIPTSLTFHFNDSDEQFVRDGDSPVFVRHVTNPDNGESDPFYYLADVLEGTNVCDGDRTFQSTYDVLDYLRRNNYQPTSAQ